MSCRRRANGCVVKVRIIRSSSAVASGSRAIFAHRAFPGWAKKAERTQILELIKPRVEELPEMQDSFSELLQDLSATRKTGAGRATSHQSRARGQERRQRDRHESPANAQHHDQRRRSSADAVDPLRPAIEERVQAGRQSRQHARGQTRFRLRSAARLPDRLPDQRRHRHARFGHAPSARPRSERADQPGHPGGEQDRSRGARSLRRRHRGDGQSFPDLESDHPGRKGRRDHQPPNAR